MTSKKTIKINKEHFDIHNSNKKPRPRNKTSTKKSPHSTDKMRKEFFKKIKEFQQKRSTSVMDKDHPQKLDIKADKDFEDEFNKSLRFLENIASSNPKQEHASPAPEMPHQYIDLEVSDFDESCLDIPIQYNKIKLPPKPPYSTLKGTSKPTYREWMKTQKSLNGIKCPSSTIVISDKPVPEETIRSKKLQQYKKEKEQEKKRNTITIKRTLGKNGKSVSVLIKSRKLRDLIQHEKYKLNHTSIHEMKKYLRSRNIIKVGSKSPNDVIRKMYEQCILAGNVRNKSTENLIHNYVNN